MSSQNNIFITQFFCIIHISINIFINDIKIIKQNTFLFLFISFKI